MNMTTEELGEHSRRWAQIVNDSTQPKPDFLHDLRAMTMRQDMGNYEMFDLAFQTIECFPPNGTENSIQQAYNARIAEEKLLEYDALVFWLCGDRGRFCYLNTQICLESPPGSLLEAMRNAYADCLKQIISTIEVFLEDKPIPDFVLSDCEEDDL